MLRFNNRTKIAACYAFFMYSEFINEESLLLHIF